LTDICHSGVVLAGCPAIVRRVAWADRVAVRAFGGNHVADSIRRVAEMAPGCARPTRMPLPSRSLSTGTSTIGSQWGLVAHF